MLNINYILIIFFLLVNSISANVSNYTFSYIAPGSYSSISGGTILTSGTFDNAIFSNQSIGFSFNFNGTEYSSLGISTNGFIWFGREASATEYAPISTTSNVYGIIAGFGEDLVGNSGGEIMIKTTGAAPNRSFTIQYKDFHRTTRTESGEFQIILYETSNIIEIAYGTFAVAISSTPSVYVGLRGIDNTDYNSRKVTSSLTWATSTAATVNTDLCYYGVSSSIRPINGSIYRWSPPVKTLTSITVTQASNSEVVTGTQNNEILKIKFIVTGFGGSMPLNSIKITANNTNNADIAANGVKLYLTASDNFSTLNQISTSQSLSGGTVTFSSLNYDLPEGNTFVWVTYDIDASATVTNTVDIQIAANDMNVNGSTYNGSSDNPAGTRTIYSPQNYYVNDVLDGTETWCTTTAGNAGNNGLTVTTPKAKVSQVLSSYTLKPGDIINVDVGSYTDQFSLTADGTATSNIKIIGAGKLTTTISYSPDFVINLTEANHNSISNLKISGLASTDAIEWEGTSNSTLDNCWVTSATTAWNAIDFRGTATPQESNYNTFKNCTFEGVDGIFTMNKNTTNFQYNKIYNCTFSSSTAATLLTISNGDYNEIYRNRFSTTTASVTAIELTAGENNRFYNNFIDVTNRGIYISGTASDSETGFIGYNSFYTGLDCVKFNVSDAHKNWEVRNNIFYNNSASTSYYCLRTASNTTNFLKCNYNHYYYPSSRCAYFGASQATLATWKTIDHSDTESLGDENSNGGTTAGDDPKFNNAATANSDNLDLLSGSPCFGAGVSLNGIVTDIYQSTRQTPPTIGAYDYTTFLPVSLVFFIAEKNNNYSVKLKWTTASEINNSYFTIERSNDAILFENLISIPGNGNSNSLLNYSVTDENPINGFNYYRLKQTDYDGKFSYSEIRAVNFKSSEEVCKGFTIIQQNTESISIQACTDINQMNFIITNALGKILFTQKLIDISTGDNFKINLPYTIKQGVYFYSFYTKQYVFSQKFIVIK